MAVAFLLDQGSVFRASYPSTKIPKRQKIKLPLWASVGGYEVAPDIWQKKPPCAHSPHRRAAQRWPPWLQRPPAPVSLPRRCGHPRRARPCRVQSQQPVGNARHHVHSVSVRLTSSSPRPLLAPISAATEQLQCNDFRNEESSQSTVATRLALECGRATRVPAAAIPTPRMKCQHGPDQNDSYFP